MAGVDWPTLPVSGLVPPSVNYAQVKTATELIDGLNKTYFNNYMYLLTYLLTYLHVHALVRILHNTCITDNAIRHTQHHSRQISVQNGMHVCDIYTTSSY